jgi:hypothetical protein
MAAVAGAELCAHLAWSDCASCRDTALASLGLGREVLRDAIGRSSMDSTVIDAAAGHTPNDFFCLGGAADGVATLDLIDDPPRAASAPHERGASSFGPASADTANVCAQRERDPQMRYAALARFVEIELVHSNVTAAVSGAHETSRGLRA